MITWRPIWIYMSLGLASVVFPGVAQARDIEICTTVAKTNYLNITAIPVNNATQFTCPGLGIKTLPELGATGWSLVSLYYSSIDPKPVPTPKATIGWIAIMEKDK